MAYTAQSTQQARVNDIHLSCYRNTKAQVAVNLSTNIDNQSRCYVMALLFKESINSFTKQILFLTIFHQTENKLKINYSKIIKTSAFKNYNNTPSELNIR